jgi:glucose-1-phosphate thymidylyltransferase
VQISKAVMLVGRTPHARRPWPRVDSGPKQLVPVANRPIVYHSLDALGRAKVCEAIMVVEPDCAGPIATAVGDGSRWGLKIGYAPWSPGTGVSGALAAARAFIADEPVLVMRADAIVRARLRPQMAAFALERLDAMAIRLRSSAPKHVEPVAGGYLLSARGVSSLLERPDTADDPLPRIRARGGQVRVQEIDGCLPCHGGLDRLLEANRLMLDGLHGEVPAASYPSCEFQGPVVVHPSARLEHTLVRGPVVIGPRSRLTNAYVGPYTAIGDDVVVEGTQLEHSIVLNRVELRYVGCRLESSVIGTGARIERSFKLPSAMRLSLGDGAEVTLG